MPKFFIKTNQINENKIKIIGEDVKHITQVLRAKVGEKLILCNIDTNINYVTNIEQIGLDFILCNILEQKQAVAEAKVEVSIFQGLPKADKLEYIIQKNTELGVKSIIPVVMRRCVTKWEEKDIKKKIERMQKIALSAAKQSKRDTIPKVENPITIAKLCEEIPKLDVVLLAYEEEKETSLKQALKQLNSFEGMKVGIIIGPEGGIEKSEVELLEKAGAKKISLGTRILRTETASVMIMSNIIYEYEL
ncbi:MAG: 16S rRNA (uracil(1498)-N(3))-methyltransferase [Clostridia bacterium]|nr:16S rRNA (uracil(1498)-N(3))-methyltransferase [Clostridia bacterium]